MSADPKAIGPFEIVRRLGVGGMGMVYEALYHKKGDPPRKVALKLLAPDLGGDAQLIARFEREMEILKKLKHPNIIRYYGGGAVKNRRFYAMEVISGGALHELITERGRLTWEQTLDYAHQIASALEHAHTAGVIHRDLKPANLLLNDNGVLKLSDFGIARDTQRTALTADGKTVGTMAYMAPEQITGKQPVSQRTDLYALGCVMYQMLTGVTPFGQEDEPVDRRPTAPEIMLRHLEEVPCDLRERAPDCPTAVQRLVEELLEKEPADRPFDALAVQVKIDEIRETLREGASLEATVVGDLSQMTAADRKTLNKALGKKKRKKKKKQKYVPVWERIEFQGPALLLLLGLIGWALMPMGEEKLYENAAKLMASEDSVDWKDARRQFIEPLLDRFPDGQYADEANAWMLKIDTRDLERQIEQRISRNKEPRNEPERLYMVARDFEQFGDRVSAIDRYKSLQSLLDKNSEQRAYHNLAGQRITAIEASVGEEDSRLSFVEAQIDQGDELFLSGKKLLAKQKWESIVRLYKDNPEFEFQVERAKMRILEPGPTIRGERLDSDDADSDGAG